MNERAHAKLSCSGAERWINCPGSVKLSKPFPNIPSVYADEGTLAHDLGETLINLGQIPKEKIDVIIKFYEMHPELNYSVDRMIIDANKYADHILSIFEDERQIDPAARLWTEMRVSLSRWIPNGFGTSDAIIVRQGKLNIIDLKFGKGVKVSAKDNYQLRLYALGALAALDDQFHIDEICMTIFQPRANNISEDHISAKDLYSWGTNVIIPAVKLTQQKHAPFKTGSWCKFCLAKHVCVAPFDKFIINKEDK